MTESRHADDSSEDFDLDWEALTFSSARSVGDGSSSMDEWEERLSFDTTGYVSDPLTTSFTDLDLEPARADLRQSPEWSDLDSWSDA